METCLIRDKKTLKEFLEYEKNIYFPDMKKSAIRRMKRIHWKRYRIWKCMYYLRKAEYYYGRCVANKCKNIIKQKWFTVLLEIYTRKKNSACEIAGIEIPLNKMGKGTDIWHGSVVINGIIGNCCCFHGTNTLGVKSNDRKHDCPKLGDRVDVGVGAMIVGDVTIADDCIIGAGSVVTKSFLTPGSVIVGVPAREIAVKNK